MEVDIIKETMDTEMDFDIWTGQLRKDLKVYWRKQIRESSAFQPTFMITADLPLKTVWFMRQPGAVGKADSGLT